MVVIGLIPNTVVSKARRSAALQSSANQIRFLSGSCTMKLRAPKARFAKKNESPAVQSIDPVLTRYYRSIEYRYSQQTSITVNALVGGCPSPLPLNMAAQPRPPSFQE